MAQAPQAMRKADRRRLSKCRGDGPGERDPAHFRFPGAGLPRGPQKGTPDLHTISIPYHVPDTRRMIEWMICSLVSQCFTATLMHAPPCVESCHTLAVGGGNVRPSKPGAGCSDSLGFNLAHHLREEQPQRKSCGRAGLLRFPEDQPGGCHSYRCCMQATDLRASSDDHCARVIVISGTSHMQGCLKGSDTCSLGT
jgi:hypothetical protein